MLAHAYRFDHQIGKKSLFAEELADIRQQMGHLDAGFQDARRGAEDTKQAGWKLLLGFVNKCRDSW